MHGQSDEVNAPLRQGRLTVPGEGSSVSLKSNHMDVPGGCLRRQPPGPTGPGGLRCEAGDSPKPRSLSASSAMQPAYARHALVWQHQVPSTSFAAPRARRNGRLRQLGRGRRPLAAPSGCAASARSTPTSPERPANRARAYCFAGTASNAIRLGASAMNRSSTPSAILIGPSKRVAPGIDCTAAACAARCLASAK